MAIKRTISRVALTILVPMALVGCYESDDVTRHEPGVYKGEQDPLKTELANNDDLREQLDQRFDGQRDR